MQIVQELCKRYLISAKKKYDLFLCKLFIYFLRPGLNKAGFEMLTIFVPTLQEKVNSISFHLKRKFFKFFFL
jgi:hypothetical protein